MTEQHCLIVDLTVFVLNCIVVHYDLMMCSAVCDASAVRGAELVLLVQCMVQDLCCLCNAQCRTCAACAMHSAGLVLLVQCTVQDLCCWCNI